MSEQQTTSLYRVENPNIPAKPIAQGVTSHPDLVGQWFSPNLADTGRYLRKSTQTFGRQAGPAEGAQLVVAHVPTDQLPELHVSRHPVASAMDVEGDNYLVPRDGSVPTDVIPLDTVISDLIGHLGNFEKLTQAQRRISEFVGAIALAQ